MDPVEKKITSKTSRKIGDEAENQVARYLLSHGHKIMARNWRTRMCEIDIVSMHDKKIYFTEVKYRKKSEHGTGLEVIDDKKLQQMSFAAKNFMKCHQGLNFDSKLAVAAVANEDFEVKDFLVLE